MRREPTLMKGFTIMSTITKALKNYISEEYQPDQLQDIVNHGCSSGCVGEVIYTYDCIKFYNKYEDAIWEIVDDFRNNTGQTLGEFIDSFNFTIEDQDRLKVCLCWFAVEQVAYQLLSQIQGGYL